MPRQWRGFELAGCAAAALGAAALALALAAVARAQLPFAPSAEAAAPGAPLLLDPIVVTASRLPQPLGDAPVSVSVIEQLDIQGAQKTVGLEEALDRVPGVFVQSSQNFAQDVRIQIRGFGTRSPFGIREIKVLMDGLPITEPDGQTQLDDVDLSAIGRIEVVRGPASSLYGNASGGVIQFFSEDAPPVPTAGVLLTGGSYGLGKYVLKGGARSERTRFFVAGSYLQLDGYREHSSTRSANFTGKLMYDLDRSTDVTLLLTAVDAPVADDPGALTRAEVDADPRQARALNVQLDAGEAVQQVRAGSVLNRRGDFSALGAYAYFTYRTFDNRLPIPPAAGDGIVAFDRYATGAGSRWEYHRPVLGWRQSFSLGADVQVQRDDRQRFQNLDGQRGVLGLHQIESVTDAGVYVRQAVYLRDDLELSAGARYDWFDYDVDVDFPAHSGGSGSRVLDAWSPSAGLRWTPVWGADARAYAPNLSLHALIGTAFQTPTLTELDNPNGPGFNPDVQPQNSITYEIGASAERADRYAASLAAYLIDITDELVPFESASGRTAFRNAGRSRRLGLEVEWQARLLPPLRWSGAVTLLDAEYREYDVGGQSFAGNEEPGIPSWWIYQELAYVHPSGLFAAAEAFLVDGYFVDDANTASAAGYALLNLRAGYERHLGERWTIASFVGLSNVTGASYNGAVRLNALSGRYFEPAPGFNVYGGISITARL
ncbi:MAG: TonB-dependent receptor family protein [Candidatus Binatia bacterium]